MLHKICSSRDLETLVLLKVNLLVYKFTILIFNLKMDPKSYNKNISKHKICELDTNTNKMFLH